MPSPSPVDQLQKRLSEAYSGAERLMSLRKWTNADELRAQSDQINSLYTNLMEILCTDKCYQEHLTVVRRIKCEFDSRLAKWFNENKPDKPESHKSKSISAVSSTSSATSSSSVRRRQEAKVRLQLAKVKKLHEEERAAEEQKKQQLLAEEKERQLREQVMQLREQEKQQRQQQLERIREAEREEELAAAEFAAWDEVCEQDADNISVKNNKSLTSKPQIAGPSQAIEAMSQKQQPSMPLPRHSIQSQPCENTTRHTFPLFDALSPIDILQDRQFSSDVAPAHPATVNTARNPAMASGRFYYDDKFLPRPELTKFNGDILEYNSFINSFETHVEAKVEDHRMLLCYLLQHCTDNVKSQIRHFSDKEDGYRLARARLHREYGHPAIVADAWEQRLKSSPNIKANDPKSFRAFSELLEKAQTVLEKLAYYGNLNSLDTLSLLINKLPFDMRKLWVAKSVEIENQTGRVASFSHFVTFVLTQAEVVNSLFGRRLFSTTATKVKSTSSFVSNSASNSVSVAKPCFVCYYCDKPSHAFRNCPEFNNASVQERIKFVKTKKYCHKCLSSKHRTPQCLKQNTCSVEGCTGTFHHTLLHLPRRNETTSQTRQPDSNVASTCSTSSNADIGSSGVYMCVIPVKVYYGSKSVVTYAFLDQGSTHTFCTTKLVDVLQAAGKPTTLSMHTLTDSKSLSSISFSFHITGLNNAKRIELDEVFAVDDIPVKPNSLPSNFDFNTCSHLKGINFQPVDGATVTLLIGANIPELFCISNSRRGLRGQPIAVETPLGWSLLGPSLTPSADKKGMVNLCQGKHSSLDEQLVSLWTNDFSAGTSVFDRPTSKEDRKALHIMQNGLEHVCGHYRLPLPFRDPLQLPAGSISMAEKRLDSLKRRLEKNPELKSKYVDAIDTYIEKGYARQIPSEELREEKELLWYLPHHPIFHPRKPEKVRVVFDCAAKHKGVSLNDALMQGPDFTNSLVGVLTSFRMDSIVLLADVESMFNQVRVRPSDANMLRFLWWPNSDMSRPPVPHQMLVHLFGATSSPSCASFCLRQTAIDFGKDFPPDISRIVRRNFYVDDCLCATSSVDNALSIYRDLSELLSKGGFHLTKWLSNSSKVLSAIPLSERSKAVKRPVGDSINEKILGVHWDVDEDTFGFNLSLPEKPCTRRGILSVTSSLYDPLGFVVPVVLISKLLLQELCKEGLDWDDPVSPDQKFKWLSWLKSLAGIRDIRIPRCIVPKSSDVVSFQLHHFSDSSTFAYGCCSYLRIVDSHGDIQCSFLMGKSRLAPIKSVPVPRLELTATVLSVGLDILFCKEMDLTSCTSTFWKDYYVRKCWAQVQYLVDISWQQWIQEHLPNVNYRQNWLHKSRNLTMNDIVLLVDSTMSLSKWLLWRVTEIFPD